MKRFLYDAILVVMPLILGAVAWLFLDVNTLKAKSLEQEKVINIFVKSLDKNISELKEEVRLLRKDMINLYSR